MFEVEEKELAWHTAFYYLGEHLRLLSGGAINHKILFDYVGDQGGYFNHGNPIVRKRTAGALSRLVHSDRYAMSMQRRYDMEKLAFAKAARCFLEIICEEGAMSQEDLLASLADQCICDVVVGLRNERDKHGRQLDIYRIDCEADALLAWIFEQEMELSVNYDELVVCMFEGIFRFMAFGHLEAQFAESLIQETPLFGEIPHRGPVEKTTGACLAKYENTSSGLTGRRWMLDPCETFSIGRYTTCDSIETSIAISRIHCQIYRESGTWYLRDCNTKYGCSVVRGREGTVYNSLTDGCDKAFPLQFEDCIELACGSSRYLFAEIDEQSDSAGYLSISR